VWNGFFNNYGNNAMNGGVNYLGWALIKGEIMERDIMTIFQKRFLKTYNCWVIQR